MAVQLLLDRQDFRGALLDELRTRHGIRQVGRDLQPAQRRVRRQTEGAERNPGRIDDLAKRLFFGRVMQIAHHIIAAGQKMRGPAAANRTAANAGDAFDLLRGGP